MPHAFAGALQDTLALPEARAATTGLLRALLRAYASHTGGDGAHGRRRRARAAAHTGDGAHGRRRTRAAAAAAAAAGSGLCEGEHAPTDEGGY